RRAAALSLGGGRAAGAGGRCRTGVGWGNGGGSGRNGALDGDLHLGGGGRGGGGDPPRTARSFLGGEGAPEPGVSAPGDGDDSVAVGLPGVSGRGAGGELAAYPCLRRAGLFRGLAVRTGCLSGRRLADRWSGVVG